MQRIAQVCNTDPLYAGEVITRTAVGNIAPFIQTVANKRGEQRHRRPVAVTDIADITALHHQRDVVADFGTNMRQEIVVRQSAVAFVLMQTNFHHFQQIKHSDIVQTVCSAWNRQLDTAYYRVIPRIFQRNTAIQKRGHHHFIVKDLRDAGTKTNGLCCFHQERCIDQCIRAHTEVWLW